jgi:hypothetical protein
VQPMPDRQPENYKESLSHHDLDPICRRMGT